MTLACPECGSADHRVYDSRPDTAFGVGIIRRRRACKGCKHRFTAFEIREDQIADVVEKALTEWGEE